MKKFKPAITIWSIDIRDRDSGVIIYQRFYLFYKQAKKDFERILKWPDTDNFEIGLGGEPLLLW